MESFRLQLGDNDADVLNSFLYCIRMLDRHRQPDLLLKFYKCYGR